MSAATILRTTSLATSLIAMAACATAQTGEPVEVTGTEGTALTATPLESFDGAWAMTFLPDGRALVTEQDGDLWLLGTDGAKLGEITGAPEVTKRNQGGLGDIILHPDYAGNGMVYLSYVERDARDNSLSGAAVQRARLNLTETGGTLSGNEVIWRQTPKVTGNGHYGHRLAFTPDGEHLFITSGERQKFTPAQNMSMNLGKVIRLYPDGSVPEDNPFHESGGVARQVWSLGHRNPLGIAFDGDGQLWVHEMGPRGGDELNRIVRSENYGYPDVSEGMHYSGTPIPSHSEYPVYEAPAVAWTPVISPAGFVIYDGEMFGSWQGHGLIGGLSSQALIRVTLGGAPAEAERYEWGERIREVEQGPDGAVYVLEDEAGGRLVKLTPAEEG